MKYYLETNICIYFLKGINEKIKSRLLEKHPDEIKISSIVQAELLYGAEKSIKKEDNLKNIKNFLFPFEIVAFGENESNSYSKIRAELEKEGYVIGPNDLLIAAAVLANGGILITNNVKEFERVKNLRIENWTE
jgi:tRNA(fMet)-specific endonuclease VapC